MQFIRKYRFFFLASFLVILDQATKVAVKGFNVFGLEHQGMQLGESFPLIGELVRITFVENPGMAFGISWGDGKIILTLITVVVSGFLIWYLNRLREEHVGVQISIMLILSGAVGNLIDRMFYGVFYGESALFYGKVVDFIQVDIPDVTWMDMLYTHWPVFNVADSCVSVGIVLMLFVSSKMPNQSKELTMSEGTNDATQIPGN